MALFVRFAQWWLARKYRQKVVSADDLRLLHYRGIPCESGTVEWFTDEELADLKKACSDPISEFTVVERSVEKCKKT